MREGESRRRWVPVLLVVLPLWLVVSGGFALWWGLRANHEREREEQARHARNVDAASLDDDVRKLVEVVGRRGTGDEAGRLGLDRAAAMIEGALGTGNAGYQVVKTAGPEREGRAWPLIEVRTGGQGRPAIWLVAGYDTRGDGVEANATGVAALLAAARALAGAATERELRLVFVPHGFEAGGAAQACGEVLRGRIGAEGGAMRVLCVESMGAGAGLRLNCLDPESEDWRAAVGLAEVHVMEQGAVEFDLARYLAESGLPAARVSAHAADDSPVPADADGSMPSLAAVAGRLVELTRRLAAPRSESR